MARHVRRSAAAAILALAQVILSFGQALAVPETSLPGRATRFSVSYSENVYTRVIMPPALPDEAMVADEGMSDDSASPCNTYVAFGSVFVEACQGSLP